MIMRVPNKDIAANKLATCRKSAEKATRKICLNELKGVDYINLNPDIFSWGNFPKKHLISFPKKGKDFHRTGKLQI